MSDERVVETKAYRLKVEARGPGFSEDYIVQDETMDILNVTPHFVDIGGVVFERYGTEDDFIEVRRDYVVARSLSTCVIEEEVGAVDPSVRRIRSPIFGGDPDHA